MKTTIYELLGMIKDGKAPKKILFESEEYVWNYVDKTYYCCDHDRTDLLNDYVMTDILNEEVQILETTITYKQEDIEKAMESVKWAKEKLLPIIDEIEKIEKKDDKIEKIEKKDDKIEKIDLYTNARCGGNMTIQEKDYNWREITNKFNEIIDRLNKEEE